MEDHRPPMADTQRIILSRGCCQPTYPESSTEKEVKPTPKYPKPMFNPYFPLLRYCSWTCHRDSKNLIALSRISSSSERRRRNKTCGDNTSPRNDQSRRENHGRCFDLSTLTSLHHVSRAPRLQVDERTSNNRTKLI